MDAYKWSHNFWWVCKHCVYLKFSIVVTSYRNNKRKMVKSYI